jgi:hypothetical protein
MTRDMSVLDGELFDGGVKRVHLQRLPAKRRVCVLFSLIPSWSLSSTGLVHSAQGLYRVISQPNERVVGLRLSEIIRRVCHELGHGLLAAEAVGLAVNDRADLAVRLYVFLESGAFCAHVAELPGRSQGRRRA